MSDRGLPPRVTLIYGNQEHASEQAVGELIDSVLGDGPRDFSLQRFDAAEMLQAASPSEALDRIGDFRAACETVPFLTERYVVLLKHVERVKAGSRQSSKSAGPAGKASKADSDADDGLQPAGDTQDDASRAPGSEAPAERLYGLLTRFAKATPEGCWLVLTAQAKAEREIPKGLLTAVKKNGRIQKFVTYDDHEPVDWVLSEARRHGLSVTREHALWLIQAIGNDMGRLAGEVEKLSLYFDGSRADGAAGATAPVPDVDAWRAAIHGEQHASLFFINDKLGEKDLPGALGVLEQFLGNRPNDLPILVGILARHLRQLHRIREFLKSGLAENDMAKRVKVHPFIFRRLSRQADRFQTVELERALQALADIDLGFRRSPLSTAAILRDFVQKICLGWFSAPPLQSSRS